MGPDMKIDFSFLILKCWQKLACAMIVAVWITALFFKFKRGLYKAQKLSKFVVKRMVWVFQIYRSVVLMTALSAKG